jgi:ornithine cyclodeaminase/alanine dehydrogenase-like protein (mu-crystallin family)
MHMLSAEATAAALPFGPLVEALGRAFAAGITAPPRQHYRMPRQGEPDAVLLTMPVWAGDGSCGGVKIVNVTPGNARRGLAAVTASFLLFDETTGEHLALIDGGTLTSRRTAAVSALAAACLARPDSRTLLVVGAGSVGSLLAPAFRAVLPIERVLVWNPTPARGERLAARLAADGFDAVFAPDLERAVAEADVISAATLSETPLIHGAWLRPGQHVDLIGSFTPGMREIDDAGLARARVYIDTTAALHETGDLIEPIASGALRADDIAGTLYHLAAGPRPLPRAPGDITLFKAVGVAVEDLVAAMVAVGR